MREERKMWKRGDDQGEHSERRSREGEKDSHPGKRKFPLQAHLISLAGANH